MAFEQFLSAEEIKAVQLAEANSDKQQKRTPEQIEAIYTHGQNVLVSASAGSGKTFVMVQRILDKLKRGLGIDQLFISTFTVKAASELKERIEKNLNETIAETTDMELRRHLSAQLADLTKADIGTMDSFTQKLVTTYGYSLGISPQFRILQDETEKASLKKEVFDQLFAEYLEEDENGAFRKLVRNFSGNRKDNSGFRQVVYQVHDFSQSTSSPTKWLKEQAVQADLYSQERIEQILEQGFKEKLLDKLYQAADFFRYHVEWGRNDFGSAKYFANVEEVLDLLTGLDSLDQKDLMERVEKVLLINDQSRGKGLTNANRPKDEHLIAFKEEYNAGKSQIISGLRDLGQEVYELTLLKDYQVQALPLLVLLRDFVLDFSQAYLDVKIKEAAFEFGDIGHFAIRILEENADIRQFFQEKYYEVMVDEYQDNNHSQERMLDLLSNGHNRFMVGDIKQSIYRFRQADPMIFQEKFELYRANPQAGKLILLTENFRSQIEVLEATNAIFTRLMDRHVGEIKYDDTHSLVAGSPGQKIAQPKHEMEYFIYDQQESAHSSTDAEEESPLTAGEIEVVAKEIIRLHNEEGADFKDITLLVQKRTHNDLIMTIFEKHGIPIVADGGASYLQSLEVMIMLDTLRVINNPLNDYALVALLKSPMFRFDEDELTRISLQAGTGFFYQKMELAQQASGQHPELMSGELKKKITDFLSILENWRAFAKLHSIYDLIWKIFNEKFYYDYVGALPNGSKRQANLYALGLRANQFEKTGYKGLSRFIAMIDRALASDKDLADVQEFLPQNAVQLMTIHKSKGLEFKYVFLMNIDKRFNLEDHYQSVIISRKNGLGIQYLADMKDKVNSPLPQVRVLMNTLPYQNNLQELKIANLSEQMRLLYVALTRAEKKLYLVGKGNADKLAEKYDGKKEDGVLAQSTRESTATFQDWILAIDEAFSGEDLHFKKVFVTDEDLTEEKIGKLTLKNKLEDASLKDIRQSEDIAQALDQLSSVQELNARYKAAIELPSLRTPSQIKKLYEPVLEQEGMEVMEKYQPKWTFALPDFSKKPKITGAQVGSAVHELMQRLDLSWLVTEDTVRDALETVHAEQAVKDNINVQMILDFFDTDLGREILANTDKLHREAPFASLQTDSLSQEQFVLRGIIDGYLLYDDHIVLFDYKTDKYDQPSRLSQRYQAQMQLYAEALKKAYKINRVDCHLILLGGERIEVVEVNTN
ncbi:helicase-exonuclease AddAB subunit AddA [Streptococcus suis]|uniref:helicase-exonuclease AddAB subunit AddA n=1 Tax=Streptococcus suis TaxID=1307 RepID=UPI0024100837|nr:helicase-exonuclease AddAB subunit AddA [Streptococcus suis]MDG3135147.1 helicase-exonuclease AddAB subunit AddA [Streptococcus suis]